MCLLGHLFHIPHDDVHLFLWIIVLDDRLLEEADAKGDGVPTEADGAPTFVRQPPPHLGDLRQADIDVISVRRVLVVDGVSERRSNDDAAHDVALANGAQRLPSVPEVAAAQEELLERHEVDKTIHL